MLEKLFENPGLRLKIFAVYSFIIECISAVIGGIWLLIQDDENLLTALLTIIGGIAGAYIVSLFIYGFGTSVENSESIKNNGKKIIGILNSDSAAPVKKEEPKKAVYKPEVKAEVKKEETSPVSVKAQANKKIKEEKNNEPKEVKAEVKEVKTEAAGPIDGGNFKNSLEYALKYSTPQGMRSHLSRRTVTLAQNEEIEILNSILKVSDSEIKDKIIEVLNML